ncbi:hypothetical protein RB25_24565 [Herbaspirillum rubrisubalbicans]|nr:hypothetical protein RB25_24565 [Herbaspirillum rubrisubalbicans]
MLRSTLFKQIAIFGVSALIEYFGSKVLIDIKTEGTFSIRSVCLCGRLLNDGIVILYSFIIRLIL